MEFRGGRFSGRFSEVANVLNKQDFQSVTATLSAVGSVSASRSVRSGRFYCVLNADPLQRSSRHQPWVLTVWSLDAQGVACRGDFNMHHPR